MRENNNAFPPYFLFGPCRRTAYLFHHQCQEKCLLFEHEAQSQRQANVKAFENKKKNSGKCCRHFFSHSLRCKILNGNSPKLGYPITVVNSMKRKIPCVINCSSLLSVPDLHLIVFICFCLARTSCIRKKHFVKAK